MARLRKRAVSKELACRIHMFLVSNLKDAGVRMTVPEDRGLGQQTVGDLRAVGSYVVKGLCRNFKFTWWSSRGSLHTLD